MRRLHPIAALIIVAVGVYWVWAWGAPRARGDAPAAATSNGASASSVSSQALIARSSQRLLQVASLQARIRVRTNLLGERFIATGRYDQLGNEEKPQFRLELRAKVAGRPAGLLVVGDGDFIWQQRSLPSSRSVTRLDLSVVDGAVASQSAFSARRHDTAPPPAWQLPPLSRLLRVLATHYHVDSAKRKVEADIDVYQLHATRMSTNPSANDDRGANWLNLSTVAPDEVTISIGRRDQFPYRIRFAFHADDEDEMPQGGSVDVQFYEVRFNEPIDQRRFHFTRPRELPWQDITPRNGA